ncbi:MAG: ribbon-helix-helix domain-containing protein [Thaumarchaeota archaeon]|nr:ribbon-helix-helix domain-containing protein [Nitrososphaerota archaeon]
MAMGRINITVNDKLEQEFRLEASKKFGFKKGSLNQAMEEALKLWIREGKKEK